MPDKQKRFIIIVHANGQACIKDTMSKRYDHAPMYSRDNLIDDVCRELNNSNGKDWQVYKSRTERQCIDRNGYIR